MPITLKDVATKSGYSVTTVSRALTGYDDVSQTTRDHILKIADELGYRPNYIARQLQGQLTHTIGLIMPARDHTSQDDFFSVLLKGIMYEAARSGYDVLVSAPEQETSEMDAYRRIAGGRRVDGMIVARTYRDDPRIEYLTAINCPFIVHGRLTPDQPSNFSYIDMDSQLGIHMLVQHLVQQGYRQIGIILPPEDVAFTPYRLAGYQEGLQEHNIEFVSSRCEYGDLTLEGGKSAAHRLLQNNTDLNAIIGCNDWMALGALAVAKDQGLQVGTEFAIVGYDDIPATLHSEPQLTTIRQPIYEIGEQLTQLLIDLLKEQPTAEIPQLVIKPKLIVRDSSGRSPH